MKIRSKVIWALAAICCGTVMSCSDLEDDLEKGISSKNVGTVDFVASLTNSQQALMDKTGSPYGNKKQKDSWHDAIADSVPSYWGVFDYPQQQIGSRAVGIYGSYPAQYWTMLRVKLLQLPPQVKSGAKEAIEEIEEKTNVRFYNSIEDEEYYEPGHIKLPNIAVRMLDSAIEGSGSYGLVGGEQYINVPKSLEQASEDDIRRFFLHAFCNAAGMFNEQQRKDRDDYVTVNLNNVKPSCKSAFDKMTKNYTMQGNFDYHSITLAASTDYSANGGNTILKKSNYSIAKNMTLSIDDIAFLNGYYLPYIPRTDNYIELDVTHYPNGTQLTEQERLDLQRQLNAQRGLYGDPPIGNRKILVGW